MERLRKAMERARAERQQSLAQPQRSTQPPPAPANHEQPIRPVGKTDGTGVQLQCRRTGQLSFDPYSLLNGRLLRIEGDPALVGVDEGVAEAYRILRTQILHRLRTESHRTLAITSPGRGDGRTTTALNLAISLARDIEQHVLLVDFDLKHPSLSRYVTPRGSPGLIDWLAGQADLEDVLIDPGIERLTILPGGAPIRHAPQLCSSPRIRQLIEALKRHRTDWLILFDMPSLFAGDAVVAALPHVDAVLLVVADGRVSRKELADAQALLGAQCIGMVLNKAESGYARCGDGE
ncbi:CpsD/CapB family tyrosine-protein kinase [Allochromatium vinosum]|nr:CpsD/CapB family tyrosine-protein kinase [Allochromatium vinosum]